MSGLSLILREDIVPPPQETYQQRIRAIVETAQDALDDSELPRARAIISEMQAMVLGRLHQAGVDNERLWAAHREKLALNAIDTVISDYADRFGKQLGKSLGTAYHSGAGTVDDGVSLVVSDWAKPTISTQEIAIAARYKPSLIRGMDEYAHDVIGRAIVTHMRTGRSPGDLMKHLAASITTQGTPFRSVAYRAELITRTEMSRVANMGAQARMLEFSRANPDAGMRQQMILSEDACDDCQAVWASAENGDGIWDVGDPDAPELPDSTHANCRCSLGPWLDLSFLKESSRRSTRRRAVWLVREAIGWARKVQRESEGGGPSASKAYTCPYDGNVFESKQAFAGHMSGHARHRAVTVRSHAPVVNYNPTERDFLPTGQLLHGEGTTRKGLEEAWSQVGQFGLQKAPIDLANSILDGSGLSLTSMTLTLSHVYDEDNIPRGFLKMELQLADQKGWAGSMEREFFLRTDSMENGQIGLRKDLTGGQSGKNIGRILTGNQVREWESAGLNEISIRAGSDVGGYVWARFGFKPTDDAWKALKGEINARADRLLAEGKMTSNERLAVDAHTGSDDVTAIWDIAAMRESKSSPSGAYLGWQLLSNTSWHGTLVLDDPESMARFNAYLRKGRL